MGVDQSVPEAHPPLQATRAKSPSVSIEKLRLILRHINPNISYEEWLRVGMAIHHETNDSDDGLFIWDDWSNQDGANYPGHHELRRKWESFKSNQDRPVTVGTLIYLARQQGYLEEAPILDQFDHSDIANKIVSSEFMSKGGEIALVRLQGQWFFYNDGFYKEREEESIRATTRKYLDRAYKINTDGEVKPFRPTMAHINSVIDALKACALTDISTFPSWLNDKNINARDFVSMENGLIHIPTLQLKPHTAEYFTLNALPYRYEPGGTATEWIKFLKSIWGEDTDSIQTLQEMFGYLLTADTSQQKMFLIKGPKRSGKGTIGRVLKEMLGGSNVCGPTLTGMAGNFGLQPLIGKLAAIVPDARIGGQTNKQAIVEKLLMISGDDNVTVDRKHIDAWTGRLTARIVMMTNETPQLGDASGALASRFIVLSMNKSYFGQEDTGLEARLIKEMPEIFCWSMAGLARLKERGRFIQPTSASNAVQELEELNSPILDFITSYCEIGSNYRVNKDRIFEEYRSWCIKQGRNFPSTLAVFSRDLQSACPSVSTMRAGSGAQREQVFSGIKIKERTLLAPLTLATTCQLSQ